MPGQEEIENSSINTDVIKEFEEMHREVKAEGEEKYKAEIIEEYKRHLELLKALEETSKHPLEEVLGKCLEQVTGGKGNERHGNGKDFMDQPWKHIADTHGDGFLTGQAAKKLQEAQSFDDLDRWNREMYGVITYTAMAILHRNGKQNG